MLTLYSNAIEAQIDDVFSNLEETDLEEKFRLAFTTYAKMLQAFNPQAYYENVKSEESLPTYRELMHMVRTIYGQPFFTVNYPHWLDASIALEMGIVLFYLYSSNFHFSEEMQEKLGQFLMDTIQKFGAYCILLNIWLPDDDDTDNTTEGIRLYHSKLQADLGLTDTYQSVDDLFNELLNEED